MDPNGRTENTQHPGDVASIRRLYSDAVLIAGYLWEVSQREGRPDPHLATNLVDELAATIAQNRTALVAVTQLKAHDEHMSTHMVNVAVLTMAQAHALGIEGALLREFGVAALMHDIGKVRTPIEILSKPDKLTDAEFAIMRMHVVDGAEILRNTPGMPGLAPTVAFEHHLRLDGSGYPIGVTRKALNLGTMLCSIADVHDAMRSHRAYQESFPTDRIIAVLKSNDGLQFDQQLVEHFTQLMGIYPPGSLVKLDTGELGVVVRVNPEDPYRPKVRVIAGPNGQTLPHPYDVDLSGRRDEDDKRPRNVVCPMDPIELGIDPLSYL